MTAKMQFDTHLANMFATGMLDNHFEQLQMIQDTIAPGFIAEITTLFCKEGWWIIDDLAKMLDKPSVDYNKVGDLLYKLRGSSATVGAQRVKNTCIQFQEFCQAKSRDGCLMTLAAMRNNFYDLNIKFHTMV